MHVLAEGFADAWLRMELASRPLAQVHDGAKSIPRSNSMELWSQELARVTLESEVSCSAVVGCLPMHDGNPANLKFRPFLVFRKVRPGRG